MKNLLLLISAFSVFGCSNYTDLNQLYEASLTDKEFQEEAKKLSKKFLRNAKSELRKRDIRNKVEVVINKLTNYKGLSYGLDFSGAKLDKHWTYIGSEAGWGIYSGDWSVHLDEKESNRIRLIYNISALEYCSIELKMIEDECVVEHAKTYQTEIVTWMPSFRITEVLD